MEKFKIPKSPTSHNKTIRIPDELIEKIEDYITKNDCTFTDFIIESIKFAFRNMDKNKN